MQRDKTPDAPERLTREQIELLRVNAVYDCDGLPGNAISILCDMALLSDGGGLKEALKLNAIRDNSIRDWVRAKTINECFETCKGIAAHHFANKLALSEDENIDYSEVALEEGYDKGAEECARAIRALKGKP